MERQQPDRRYIASLARDQGRCMNRPTHASRGSGKVEPMTTEEAAHDVTHAWKRAAPFGWRANHGWREFALSIGYVALYLALDRLSFIGALHGIGITPWNPTAGLAMALLIIRGLRYAPLVMAAEVLSGAVLPVVSPSAVAIFLGSLIVTAGYTGAAAVLRHAGLETSLLRRSSDIVLILIAAIIGSGLVASGFVGSYALAGVIPWSDFVEGGFHFWIGDAIGIVVLLPPLLLLYSRIKQRAPPLQSVGSFHLGETAAQAASVILALAAVFSGMGGNNPLGLFYLLFPPLIWIATRRGLSAASWAVLAVQIGSIAGLEIRGHTELTLRAFQLFMFALAATGLMLGAVVSERRRLSLALVDSEGLRRAILDTVPDGILTIDERGGIRSINPAVETLFLRPSYQLIGHDVGELIENAPDLLSRLKRAVHSPTTAGCRELDGRRADGTTFPIELSAGRFDLLGAEHYAVVLRDITLRREAEARDRQHQAKLAHVSRVSLAGEMAAGLAHELSQPLTAIIAYARGCLRLLAGPVPERALLHEGIDEVVQQAERAADVLDRLREFVRGGEFRRALTEIKPVIDAAVSLVHSEAMQQEVEIEAIFDSGLPVVLADPVQIEQVLLNLLRNAMDAMETANTERRSIIVEARRSGKHAMEIAVADSGPGVAPEMTDAIFEPFITTKPLGMGMGLAISRAIIESHGGNLQMARGTGSGAIFIFNLPTAEAKAGVNAG
jgi:two-component system, LuxR family, sensor kinase FixL